MARPWRKRGQLLQRFSLPADRLTVLMRRTNVLRRNPSFAAHRSRPKVRAPFVIERTTMPYQNKPARLLVIPGLHGSGEAHWQTWLQAHYKRSRRVEQDDWRVPDLARWSACIEQTLGAEPPGPWIAVAHSFGCLALAHHLAQRGRKPGGIGAALLVAPADPARFGVDDRL